MNKFKFILCNVLAALLVLGVFFGLSCGLAQLFAMSMNRCLALHGATSFVDLWYELCPAMALLIILPTLNQDIERDILCKIKKFESCLKQKFNIK